MEFKVGDRVQFVGGRDLTNNRRHGLVGTVVKVDPSEYDDAMISVRFDNQVDCPGEEKWYAFRFALYTNGELQESVNPTNDPEIEILCAEISKMKSTRVQFEEDLKALESLASGFVTIGIGSEHFRLGFLNDKLFDQLKQLIQKARQDNIEEANKIQSQNMKNLKDSLTNAR